MDRPTEICDGLVDLERVLTPFLCAKTIVVLFQAAQYSHPALGERIPLDAGHSQEGRHIFEMFVEK